MSLIQSRAIDPWRLSGSSKSLAVSVLAVVAGSLLLVASARAQVPMWPVPMTMQTLAVILIGAWCGPRLGGLVLAAYLAEGALGLPVFSGTPERGVGLAYMAGPTGGFLAGFLAAAVLVGAAVQRGWARSWTGAFGVGLAAHAVVLAAGAAWLAPFVGLDQAIAVGVVPFIVGSLLKAGLAAAILKAIPGRRNGAA